MGKTHPLILDPELLNKLCMQMLLSLKLEYSVDSCQTIADLIKVTSFHYNNELLIQMTIPQVNEQSYNLYKLFITPIPISSTYSSIYNVESEFIAVDVSENTFILLMDKDISNCKKVKISPKITFNICAQNIPIHLSSSNKCITGLYLQTKSNNCEQKIIKTSNYFTRMYNKNSWLYSLTEPRSVVLNFWHRSEERIKINNTGIISINNPGTVKINNQIWKINNIIPVTQTIRQPDEPHVIPFNTKVIQNLETNAFKIIDQKLINEGNYQDHNTRIKTDSLNVHQLERDIHQMEHLRRAQENRMLIHTKITGSSLITNVIIIAGAIGAIYYIKKKKRNSQTRKGEGDSLNNVETTKPREIESNENMEKNLPIVSKRKDSFTSNA